MLIDNNATERQTELAPKELRSGMRPTYRGELLEELCLGIPCR